MLAGPSGPFSGLKRAAPVKPGYRGQLARLIRERPLFVNCEVAGLSFFETAHLTRIIQHSRCINGGIEGSPTGPSATGVGTELEKGISGLAWDGPDRGGFQVRLASSNLNLTVPGGWTHP